MQELELLQRRFDRERLARKQAESALEKKSLELYEANETLRETNQRLAVAAEAAETATRSKSEFLANMSHEIRTPMTAILGFADALLDPTLGGEERLNAIHTIRRNGEHLLGIINDVLDLSKV